VISSATTGATTEASTLTDTSSTGSTLFASTGRHAGFSQAAAGAGQHAGFGLQHRTFGQQRTLGLHCLGAHAGRYEVLQDRAQLTGAHDLPQRCL